MELRAFVDNISAEGYYWSDRRGLLNKVALGEAR